MHARCANSKQRITPLSSYQRFGYNKLCRCQREHPNLLLLLLLVPSSSDDRPTRQHWRAPALRFNKLVVIVHIIHIVLLLLVVVVVVVVVLLLLLRVSNVSNDNDVFPHTPSLASLLLSLVNAGHAVQTMLHDESTQIKNGRLASRHVWIKWYNHNGCMNVSKKFKN